MEYTNEECKVINRLAGKIVARFCENDRSGRLLYLFMCKISGLSKLVGFRGDDKYSFVVVKESEYKKLKNALNNECVEDQLNWVKEMVDNI